MKVSELSGALLDYWVARAEGYEYVDVPPDADGKNAGRALLPPGLLKSGWTFPPKGKVGNMVFPYSTSWEQGGPIIEQNFITVRHFNRSMYNYKHTPDGWVREPHWAAYIMDHPTAHYSHTGSTPLVAAMRAYVASRYGDEVPDEAAT